MDEQQNDNNSSHAKALDGSQPTSDANLEQLQADLDSALNNWKRAAADFENYKKRNEREQKELVEFAREVTVAKLLPTLDTLEQAFKHLPTPEQCDEKFMKDYVNWQNGAKGVVMQLDKILEELGVKRIVILPGNTKFDPNFHEAVKEVESEYDDQVIHEVLQNGFVLNGKVIRPSQVAISKKK